LLIDSQIILLKMDKNTKGFTLIELIIVIAIMTILSTGLVFFINPSQKMSEARDRRRRNDVYTIYGALEQYAFLNEGLYPEAVTGSDIDAIEIEGFLVPDFLNEIPMDPSCSDETSSEYYVKKNEESEIEVTASCAENGEIVVNSIVF
jgi:prepilin-type N-terminal cleavage/methylation domain-containing protein